MFLCALCALCTTINKILRGLRRKSESSFLFLRKLHFLGCRASELILTRKKLIRPHIDRTLIHFLRVPLCLRVSVVQFLTFCPLLTLFLCVEGLFLVVALPRCG